MFFRINYFLTCVVCWNWIVEGANILAITAVLSPSHHIFNDVYLFELVKRGHNVTLLGHDEDKHGHPNYTHIVMEDGYNKMQESVEWIKLGEISEWETISLLWSYGENVCLIDYQTKGFQKIRDYPDGFKFDLVLWDINVGLCLLPLLEKFGRPPIIGINAFINQPNIFRNVFQCNIPFITQDFSGHMTLWQKFKAVFFTLVFEMTRVTHFLPRQQELADSYFGKLNVSIQEFERNVSLVLANYNPVFNYVEALPFNIVPVGGLHIQPKPLPEDFKQILDNSKSGLILFSLGSNVQSKDLENDKIQTIIKTFSKLKQTVIWKFDQDSIPNIPKNVHIRKWVPQNDILGHKNTVLFISHCGLLSSHEIIYNGVPVVGIPLFLDQKQNMANLASKGVGEKFDFKDLDAEEKFYNIIQKVLNNKSYHENVKKLSTFYKHQMNSPMERAIYWTEYILKFKSAKHFDLATRDMNFLERTDIDVVLLFLLPLFPIIFLISGGLYFCVFKLLNSKVESKVKKS